MSAMLELSCGCVNFPLDLLRKLAGRIPCLTDQGNSSEKAEAENAIDRESTLKPFIFFKRRESEIVFK